MLASAVRLGEWDLKPEATVYDAEEEGEDGELRLNWYEMRLREEKLVKNEANKRRVGMASYQRGEARVVVSSEGKGHPAQRGVDSARDWCEVEKIVRTFIRAGRKGVRVDYAVVYRSVDGVDEDYNSEDYEPKVRAGGGRASPTPAPKRRRRTTTEIERERAQKDQALEHNFVPELFERWRCQRNSCDYYEKGACLVYPNENKCRPLSTDHLNR